MAERVEGKPTLIKNLWHYKWLTMVPLGASLLIGTAVDNVNVFSNIDSQAARENPSKVSPGELVLARNQITLFDQREHDALLATGEHVVLSTNDKVKVVKAFEDLKQEEQRIRDVNNSRVALRDTYNGSGRSKLLWGVGVGGIVMMFGGMATVDSRRKF